MLPPIAAVLIPILYPPVYRTRQTRQMRLHTQLCCVGLEGHPGCDPQGSYLSAADLFVVPNVRHPALIPLSPEDVVLGSEWPFPHPREIPIVCRDDLQLVECIGRGSYGTVSCPPLSCCTGLAPLTPTLCPSAGHCFSISFIFPRCYTDGPLRAVLIIP